MKVMVLGGGTSTAEVVKRELESFAPVVTTVPAERLKQGEKDQHLVFPEVILVEHSPPDDGYLRLLQQVLHCFPAVPVITLSCVRSIELAVKTVRLGAFDYIVRESGYAAKLAGSVKQALEKGRTSLTSRAKPSLVRRAEHDRPCAQQSLDSILGESQPIRELKQRAAKVMVLDLHVLIRGETGTGKELLARGIHCGSPRSGRAFVPVNCAALAPELVESELFGHEKGAFTGAIVRRPGKVLEANRGTLFLDEVGDLPAAMQAKLLRLLQEGEIQRVGADRPIIVDVRVLAATNKPLEVLAANGLFRADLYHRLNAISLTIPPLRQRGQDILMLARIVLERFSSELVRPVPRLTLQAEAELLGYEWSGNFRELENIIRRELLFCEGDVIHSFGLKMTSPAAGSAAAGNPTDGIGLLDVGEGDQLVWLLRRHRGNLSRVARQLRVSRPTAYKRIHAHGLRLRDFR